MGSTLVLLFCLTIILAVIFGLGFPQSGKYAVYLDTSPYTLLGQMALLVVLPYILSQTMVHLLDQQWLVRYKIISKGITLILVFCIVAVSI